MSESLKAASRWSAEQAWEWHKKQPFLVGANFNPSSAINQLEMWQAETFDPAGIDRELGWAAKLGMNVMRVYLHNLCWEQDAEGFFKRMDQYLDIASKQGIKTLFTIFDDCWNPEFALGKQPAPKPGQHNSGWVQSPGKKIVNDPASWPALERYVKALLTRFREDERILGWDLYNEPGNGNSGDDKAGAEKQGKGSLPLLKAVFDWARSVEGLTQPLTCAAWNFSEPYKELNDFSFDHSDVISFHSYSPPMDLSSRIRELQKHGRPMICSEYMARGAGSTFEYCLPILKKYGVAAMNWGLVSGKTQTIYPWGWNAEKGVPDIWFHDVFNADGTLLYPNEARVFKQLTQA
jgi:hypothetical protein